jgi:hypothetical protein
MTHLETFP